MYEAQRGCRREEEEEEEEIVAEEKVGMRKEKEQEQEQEQREENGKEKGSGSGEAGQLLGRPIDWKEALYLGTRGGYEALGLKSCGTFHPGAPFDAQQSNSLFCFLFLFLFCF